MTRIALVVTLAFAGCWLPPDPPSATDPGGRSWHTVSNAGGPGPLFAPRMAFDPIHERTVLYGGRRGPAEIVGYTWTYDGTTWTKLCDPCGPGLRYLPAFGFDPISGRILLIGGSSTAVPVTLLSDAWALDGDTWSPLAITGFPPQVGGTLVSARGVLGVIGGDRDPTSDLDRAEVYTSTNGSTWTKFDLPEPTPSTVAGTGTLAVYDEVGDRFIVIEDGSATIENDGAHDRVHALAMDGWHAICADDCGMDRTGASLLRIPGDATYLVMGYRPQTEISGTWMLDEAEAHWRLSDSNPVGRDSFGLVWDSARARAVLYGGNGNICGGDCSETIELY